MIYDRLYIFLAFPGFLIIENPTGTRMFYVDYACIYKMFEFQNLSSHLVKSTNIVSMLNITSRLFKNYVYVSSNCSRIVPSGNLT